VPGTSDGGRQSMKMAWDTIGRSNVIHTAIVVGHGFCAVKITYIHRCFLCPPGMQDGCKTEKEDILL